MMNQDKWQPSKYVYKKGRLIASRDKNEVNVGSRLIADIIAGIYDEHLKSHAKGKLLDLGCGKVPLFMAYKDYVTDNICVDWENSLHENKYLDYVCDLTKPLPFDDQVFDTIILSDVLEHIFQPDHLWMEIHRLLSINGKIIMNVPFFYCLHERPYDYFRYTEFALKLFVENSGLRLILIKPIGGAPEILADIIAKHVQFIPFIGNVTAIFIQSMAKHFVNTRIGSGISKKTAQIFPFGYFLIAEKTK